MEIKHTIVDHTKKRRYQSLDLLIQLGVTSSMSIILMRYRPTTAGALNLPRFRGNLAT